MIDPIGACLSLIAAVAGLALSGVVVAHGLDLAARGAQRTQGTRGTQGTQASGLASVLGGSWLDRWLVRFALGAVGWMTLLFALAAAGRLARAPIVLLAILLPACGLALELRERSHHRLRAVQGESRPPAAWRWLAVALGIAAIAATGLALAARALIPDVSWDADVYHLTVPRIYLEHGGFVRIPFNVYSNWPLGTELLFAAAMALRDFVLAKLLHLAFGVASALLAWRLAAGAGAGGRGAPSGVVAAALFLANPVVLAEMTVAYVDLASAFFLLLGFAGIHAAFRHAGSPATTGDLPGPENGPPRMPPDSSSPLLLAGLCAGALAAIKITGVLAAVCLAVLLALEAWRARWPWRARARALLLLAVPVSLLLVPWLVKSWMLTGNPVYPFLYSTFGGPEWSESLSESLARWQRAIGMGREPVDFLLLPLRVVLEGGDGYARFDGRISPLWLVLAPLSVWTAWRDELVRRAMILAGLSFLVWAATSQQMRFLVPVLALLAVAAARALDEVVRVLGRWPALSRAAAPAPALLASALLLWLAWPWGRVALDNLPALGRHYEEMRAALIEPAHRFVSQELPPEARLLMLDHNRGFHVRREYLADSFLEASQIAELFRGDDAEAAARRLRELGITHVLVERRRPGAEYPEGLLAVVAAARPLYRAADGRITIAELAPAAPMVETAP